MQNALMALPGAVLTMAPGCATIMSQGGKSPAKWPVTIESDPPGADIVVRNHRGEVAARGKAPLKATLESKAGFIGGEMYHIESTVSGFDRGEWTITPTSNRWGYGNYGVFAVGFVALGVSLPLAAVLLIAGPCGILVDNFTGAEFLIENHYVVPLARPNGGR